MEAATLYQRALYIRQSAMSADDKALGTVLTNLGRTYLELRRYDDAALLFEKALKTREQNAARSRTLEGLAKAYRSQGRLSEARLAYEKALSVKQAGNIDDAEVGNTFEDWLDTHPYIAWSSFSALGDQGEERYIHANRALANAQLAQTATGTAVAQMSARFGNADTPVARLVRERQDRANEWHELDKTVLAALLTAKDKSRGTAAESLQNRKKPIADRIQLLSAQIETQFPDYEAFANPKPLPLEEVQNLVAPDEALVVFLLDGEQGFVWAVARDQFDWQPTGNSTKNLAAKIAAFRSSLNVDKPGRVDIEAARAFYADLLAPIEPVIRNKRHLQIVPSGSLTALPFHLLVTDPPVEGGMQITEPTGYRNVAWLIKRHAISVLPSVASLKALRLRTRSGQARQPMIGFGDPVFGPETPARPEARAARAYTEFWQGSSVDRDKLSSSLPRLADTSDELLAVANKVGADQRDIYLRERATEAMVKGAPLQDFRVVYFATHGLVAGDVVGLGEPALALTLPAKPSDFDDGLLTASEVAQLKLNADWVVLSACNTMAGNAPGAEALSGLARAFFYAGSRALLVSHWAVESAAATRLTTLTFAKLTASPAIGRAEALRQAMLEYMRDAGQPDAAHPAFWAPFSIIGEGAKE